MAKLRLFPTRDASARAAAHRAMAKAALFSDSSAAVRLKRYNHHTEKARHLEARASEQNDPTLTPLLARIVTEFAHRLEESATSPAVTGQHEESQPGIPVTSELFRALIEQAAHVGDRRELPEVTRRALAYSADGRHDLLDELLAGTEGDGEVQS